MVRSKAAGTIGAATRREAEKRDVMVRSFPVEAHEKAKLAAAARGMALGAFLGQLVDAHTRLLWYASHHSKLDADANAAKRALELTGLAEVRR